MRITYLNAVYGVVKDLLPAGLKSFIQGAFVVPEARLRTLSESISADFVLSISLFVVTVTLSVNAHCSYVRLGMDCR